MRCIDRWIDLLNTGNPNRPYRITAFPSYPNRRPELFGLAVKPASGERLHPDGNRWRIYYGPTYQQARIMAETSPNNEELIRRIDLFVLKGQDTTQAPPKEPQYSESQIDQMVNEKVEAILKQKIDEIIKAKEGLSALPALSAPPRGLQERPKRPAPKVQASAREEKIQVWRQRAKLMGFAEPTIAANKQIHKTWLAEATVKWDEYCKTGQTVAAEPV